MITEKETVNVSFYLNLLINFPTINTMLSLYFIANFLPIALQPTVNEDTIAVMIISIIGLSFNNITKPAAKEPDIIPHISPITSLHTLLVLFEFFINWIHSLAPFTLLAALA